MKWNNTSSVLTLSKSYIKILLYLIFNFHLSPFNKWEIFVIFFFFLIHSASRLLCAVRTYTSKWHTESYIQCYPYVCVKSIIISPILCWKPNTHIHPLPRKVSQFKIECTNYNIFSNIFSWHFVRQIDLVKVEISPITPKSRKSSWRRLLNIEPYSYTHVMSIVLLQLISWVTAYYRA